MSRGGFAVCAALWLTSAPLAAQPADTTAAPATSPAAAPAGDAPTNAQPASPAGAAATATPPTPAASAQPGADTAPAAPAAPAEPSADVQAEYHSVVERAVTEFDAGRWAEARALFLRAHELWPSARTLRTLGMTSFELRTYARALRELQAALDDPRRPLPDAHRAEVQQLIERTRAFVGRFRVRLSPPDASLLVDGAPWTPDPDAVLVLAVGSHELLARAPEHSELRRRLDVQGHEDQELALELTPVPVAVAAPAPVATPPAAAQPVDTEPAEEGGRLWTWIAAGTAVALGGTSTALWLVSDSKYDKEYERCHPGGQAQSICSKDEVATSWQDLQTAHQVTAVLAGVAGAAAVALFFIEGSGGEERPTISLGPGAVYASGRF